MVSLISIRIYQLYKIIKIVQKDAQTNTAVQKIIPSISLKEDFLNIKVDLPPVGLYCKGCDDGISKGLFTKSPKTGELILARARSITGGYDTPAGGKKWSYTYYAFKSPLSELPLDNELVIPGDIFLLEAIYADVGTIKKFTKSDSNNKGILVNYTYKK